MRIVFMGTPNFSVPCLQALIDDGHDVCAVFTQPDKPKGRHGVLTPPPVKELALKYDIPVYQPKTLKTDEAKELFKSLNADLAIVVAYGKILPGELSMRRSTAASICTPRCSRNCAAQHPFNGL